MKKAALASAEEIKQDIQTGSKFSRARADWQNKGIYLKKGKKIRTKGKPDKGSNKFNPFQP